MAMLELQNVHSSYGAIKALQGISLTVEKGEIVTLIGSNGAGKSTTLRTISGLIRPTQGKVMLGGDDITSMPAHKIVEKGVAHVPEGRKIFPRLNVRENLEIGAYTVLDKVTIAERVAHVFDLFPRLRERTAQLGGTLSGGEQQMLAIGRGMMMAPKILMLDEPSMGLAPIIVDQIFEIIQMLNKQGVTILLVEQNALRALQVAHRGYVIATGEIQIADTALALQSNPAVREAYLGEG